MEICWTFYKGMLQVAAIEFIAIKYRLTIQCCLMSELYSFCMLSVGDDGCIM